VDIIGFSLPVGCLILQLSVRNTALKFGFQAFQFGLGDFSRRSQSQRAGR
jgi:hypothetical protein